MRASATGFSLIELIVTTTLVGILAALAIPSFINILRNNRLAAYTNEFTTALTLARTESVKRNVTVGVCRSANATSKKPSCDSGSGNGGWENGWLVFADLNHITDSNDKNYGKDKFDDGEPILHRHGALAGGLTVTGSNNVANRVFFTSRGIVTTNGMGSFAFNDGRAEGVRLICLPVTGRPRLTANGVTAC
ncbi:MAG: GspH/FimT family pseudopilin [Stenotrophobium sp.]